MSRLGSIKRLVAILIALVVVLAAGIAVGQAPVLFDVDEEPTASIEFEDQEGNGTAVTIDEVMVSDGGFIVIRDSGGELLGVSAYLESGSHENVTVERDDEPENNDGELFGQLTAIVHQDTTDNQTFDYLETDGAEDRPYLEGGYPVSNTAVVTTDDPDVELAEESFTVESIDVPETATTNETIEVVAAVHNPTDNSRQQPVDFRLDGQVIERHVVDLDPGETRNVTFDIDTSIAEPGNQSVGVFTAADGAVATIEFEFHAPPSIEVTGVEEVNVTVDAALPEAGFVAIEDDAENETEDAIIATSGELDPGEHTNVTVTLDEPVDEYDTANLSAVLYEGDPDDVENASAFEVDGERVEASIGGEVAADDDTDTDDAEDADTEANDEATVPMSKLR